MDYRMHLKGTALGMSYSVILDLFFLHVTQKVNYEDYFATQTHWKNMPVVTFLQKDIMLLLACFATL